MTSSPDRDGIDVAIAAFLGARLNGETIEEATKNAEAILELFGIPRITSKGEDGDAS